MVTKETCSCSSNKAAGWTATGGVLASLGICSACCLLPAVLVSLGVGGAWASHLEALAPYKWIFVGATVALIAYGIYLAYLRPRRCTARRITPPRRRRQGTAGSAAIIRAWPAAPL